MKPFIAALALAWCVTASAQSVYTNLNICGAKPPEIPDSTGYFTSVYFEVPANTTAEVVSQQSQTEIGALVNYPSSTNWLFFPLRTSSTVIHSPSVVLGPATLRFNVTFYYQTNCANFLLKLDPVNTTPGGIGAAQLPESVRAVELQASTNLTDWRTVTLTTNQTGQGYEFFRVQIH